METKNWIRSFAIVCLALFIFSSNIFAFGDYSRYRRHRRHHHRCTDCRPVSAPLDGGIVAILGVASIAYFIIRKKKK